MDGVGRVESGTETEQLPKDGLCDEQGRSNVTSRQGCLLASDPWAQGQIIAHLFPLFGVCKRCDQAHSFHGNNAGKVFAGIDEFSVYWRSKMKRNQKIRGAVLAVLAVALLVTAVLSLAQAQDYNDGLMAAKVGDYNAAVIKWKPLALQGDAMAQFNMALMYHRGLGVGIDEARAVAWYKMSAKNGYIKAQEFLAAAYNEGWFGLPNDQAKANYWLQLAEEQSL